MSQLIRVTAALIAAAVILSACAGQAPQIAELSPDKVVVQAVGFEEPGERARVDPHAKRGCARYDKAPDYIGRSCPGDCIVRNYLFFCVEPGKQKAGGG